jgi:hypothetical protein
MAQMIVPDRFLDAGEEPDQTLTPIEGYEKAPLVSLKEAVQPIKSFLHNVDSMVETAKRNSRKPADSLTSDESAAIHLYTMQWPKPHPSLYTLLNERHLRHGFSFLNSFLLHYINSHHSKEQYGVVFVGIYLVNMMKIKYGGGQVHVRKR